MMIRSLGGCDRVTALSIWENSAKIDDEVYVCYTIGEIQGVVVDVMKDDLRRIRAFISSEPAMTYAKARGSSCRAVKVKMSRLMSDMASAYADHTTSQVLCVLTELDRAGNLYDVDVIWQLNCN